MKINIVNRTNREINRELEALNALGSDLGLVLDETGDTIQLFTASLGYEIDKKDGITRLSFSTVTSLTRAFAALKQYEFENEINIKETPELDSVGVMIDCSRNSVLTVESIKRLCRIMALMGHNTIMLYTEDTYEIEGQPYFGYMRGRYTPSKLKECDDYAALLGIEIIPCIQTLAHLNAIFRWDKFKSINDLGDILLAEDEGTYQLIDEMLSAMSANLTSRKIHIGMDEAHMLGLGEYLQRHGYKNRTQIMVDHLTRVVELCKKYGYEPIMWSDMFFRLKNPNYYALDTEIDQAVIDLVPPEVALTYWDYYHTDVETYDIMIKKHQRFNNKTWFAGGTWSWQGILPINGFGLSSNRPAIEAVRKSGIKHAIVTSWGDGGGECSIFAVLPTLQLYAEGCWSGDTSDENLADKMKISSGMAFESGMMLELPHQLPGSTAGEKSPENPANYLLYQDVLLGLFDRYVREGSSKFYAECNAKLAVEREKNPRWQYLFDTAIAISKVLELKVEMGIDLKKAYDADNRVLLKQFAEEKIPALIKRVDKLHAAVKAQWLRDFKVFGMEVQDIRFGALKQRLLTAAERVDGFLKGEIERIEELEQDRLLFSAESKEELPSFLAHQNWALTVTTSNI